MTATDCRWWIPGRRHTEEEARLDDLHYQLMRERDPDIAKNLEEMIHALETEIEERKIASAEVNVWLEREAK